MKRILIVVLTFMMAATTIFAVDFSDLETDTQEFANGVASSLPLNASVGLNWSDAYIGQFPRFGVGLTVGASTIPFAAATPILEGLGIDDLISQTPELEPLVQFGMPLPAYAAEARLGGFLFPFDIGVKVGALPPDWSLGEAFPNSEALQRLELDYLNLGFDVRVPLVEEGILMPEIAVGGGYNYLRARLGFNGILGEDLVIGTFPNPVPTEPDLTITMADPTVNYDWSANVIDLKAQISKSLLVFRPYLGVGASIGFGRAGSGFESALQGITEDQIRQVNEAAALLGNDQVIPDLTNASLSLSAPMTGGWSFRALGGVALNILIVKLDLNVMYDFLAGNYGATVGLRVQI